MTDKQFNELKEEIRGVKNAVNNIDDGCGLYVIIFLLLLILLSRGV